MSHSADLNQSKLSKISKKSLPERAAELVQKFQSYSDWEDRYRLIIQMGKELPALPDEEKLSDHLIKGCQSQVWLVARQNEEGVVHFEADSDALMAKGIISILLKIYSEAYPDEILNFEESFLKEIDLLDNLTPSRANGLYSMVKQIKFYALAYKMKGH